MSTHTIEISGISDELLRRLDVKVREQNAPDRSTYILELLARDTEAEAEALGSEAPKNRFREILAPIHAETERLGYTDEEIDEFVDEVIAQTRHEQQPSASRNAR